MKKVFQTMYGLFRKSRDNISKTLDEKESDKAAEEFIQKSNEIKEELQRKIEQTNKELQEKLLKSKETVNKKNSSQSKKKTTTKKTAPKKKTTAKKSTTKTTTKKSTSTKKVEKKTTPKKKATAKKATTKKVAPKKEEIKYPSGLIVNSLLLTSVERGYLELAGFKNYKDVLVNLSSPSKRTKIAKEVTTTPGALNAIVKKIELLQVKGLGENVAILLSNVGINSINKLQKANIENTIKKITKFKKENTQIETSLSSKQLEKLISNSN